MYLSQICSKLTRSFSSMFTLLFQIFLSVYNFYICLGANPISFSLVKHRFLYNSVISASNPTMWVCTWSQNKSRFLSYFSRFYFTEGRALAIFSSSGPILSFVLIYLLTLISQPVSIIFSRQPLAVSSHCLSAYSLGSAVPYIPKFSWYF